MAGRKNDLSVVAQDRNWRSYVDNELACQDRWNADWGFLSGSSQGEGGKFIPLKTKRFWALLIESGKKIATTKEEKITSIEE